MKKLVNNKTELCELITATIRVTGLSVKDLTEGTKNIDEAFHRTMSMLATEILNTPIKKQNQMKELFKEYNIYNEEMTYKALYYLTSTYNLDKLDTATDEEIVSLLERAERVVTNFALLYAMDSGYARNSQLLDSYRWVTQKAIYQVENEAVDRGMIVRERDTFEWE